MRSPCSERLLQGRSDEILTLADNAPEGAFSRAAADEIGVSRSRLRVLLNYKRSVLRRFLVSLFLTVGLIGFSVVVLTRTPYIAESLRAAYYVFTVGLLWFFGCLASYAAILTKSLRYNSAAYRGVAADGAQVRRG